MEASGFTSGDFGVGAPEAERDGARSLRRPAEFRFSAGERMRFEAHEYQRAAIAHILGHPVSALFLDMGLGKTVITLTALKRMLDAGEIRRALVVAPLRVARDTWPAEAEKWEHLKGLSIASATGDVKRRRAALAAGADVTCIGRDSLIWLAGERGLPRWDCIVIDELSSFKNWQAKRYKVMWTLRKEASRIIGLTGTPASNGLDDLWAEFRIMDMGERLGRSIGKFRDDYEVPDRRSGMQIYSWKARPGAEARAAAKIADVTLTMKAVEKLKMPELISTVQTVKMSRKEAEVYDEMRREMVIDEGEVTAGNAAALAGKLAQMAGGCVYRDDGSVREIQRRKLDALLDLLEAAQGQSVLIAYWYQHERARIEEALKEVGIGFRRIEKSSDILAWNAGKVQAGLIHPASAGHGLNLQAGGRNLVWYSLPWSLELYQQTNARLWRQGQQAGTVVVQHLCTEGTIDLRILEALRKKDCGQEALIGAVKAAREAKITDFLEE